MFAEQRRRHCLQRYNEHFCLYAVSRCSGPVCSGGGGGGASTQIQDGVVCAVLAQLLLKENIFRVIAFPFSLCFIEV